FSSVLAGPSQEIDSNAQPNFVMILDKSQFCRYYPSLFSNFGCELIQLLLFKLTPV
ncbi:Uncharacterized protein APZ42_000167, partial [Daphnia magna]